MKKKALVAAILAATTLSATPAFAAQNPFKDMPEGHWAYDAVNMLVKDGVVEGYGDGTFGGDKLMNRYEMAEIVANAAKKYGSVGMKDKGAIKKLQREFKAELKDMDARLAGVEQDVAQLKKRPVQLQVVRRCPFPLYAEQENGNEVHAAETVAVGEARASRPVGRASQEHLSGRPLEV